MFVSFNIRFIVFDIKLVNTNIYKLKNNIQLCIYGKNNLGFSGSLQFAQVWGLDLWYGAVGAIFDVRVHEGPTVSSQEDTAVDVIKRQRTPI